GAAGGLALWGVWRLSRRFVPAAQELEERLARPPGAGTPPGGGRLPPPSRLAPGPFFPRAAPPSPRRVPPPPPSPPPPPAPASRLCTAFALVAGLLLGWMMLWRGNLLGPVVAHALVNGINLRKLGRAAAAERG